MVGAGARARGRGVCALARPAESKDSERSGRMTGRTGGMRGGYLPGHRRNFVTMRSHLRAGRHLVGLGFARHLGHGSGGRGEGARSGDERARARIERASEGAEGGARVRV